MNKEPADIEQILPYGEMLRGFMEQSFVTRNDLKNLLRNRGVFTHNNEKHDTVPTLMSTILSPSEFDYLRESQNSKEDNPKVITQTIEWDSDKNLLESLPENFNLNSMLDLEFSNFKVNGNPDFIPVNGNPDKLKMNFNIERDDMSKSWASSKSIYPGSLEVSRIEKDKEVKLVVTHTANETKYVAKKASYNLVKHFKNEGCIQKDKEIEKILFSKFSNANRIEYLMSLSKSCNSSLLSFSDILDIEFSPDTENKLPDGMKWMEDKINDLKLNGKDLHKTFFVKEKKYHDFINLYRIDSRFKFDLRGLGGKCVITIHFPEYSKSNDIDAELEINIKSISFNIPPRGITKGEVKEEILHDIENQKIKQFKIHSDKK